MAVPALEPGQGANMRIPVTVPANATAGTVPTTATYLVRGWQRSHGDGTLTVTAPRPDPGRPRDLSRGRPVPFPYHPRLTHNPGAPPMSSSQPLRGVVPPVCTPLDTSGEVDTASLARHVEHLVSGGVHGLFALGSSSEVAFLTDRPRAVALETVVEAVAGRVPVLAGAIATTTPRVLAHAEAARAAGAAPWS
ncbi:4-hydroxy-tetrahydrodipicolinate synthase [Streptomyces griseomycini]